jgi:hypothetical protein
MFGWRRGLVATSVVVTIGMVGIGGAAAATGGPGHAPVAVAGLRSPSINIGPTCSLLQTELATLKGEIVLEDGLIQAALSQISGLTSEVDSLQQLIANLSSTAEALQVAGQWGAAQALWTAVHGYQYIVGQYQAQISQDWQTVGADMVALAHAQAQYAQVDGEYTSLCG